MMTFVNLNSPALVILPTHRVVHSLDSFSADHFRDSARAFFDVEEVYPSFDAPDAIAIFRESGRTGTTILAVTPNRAFLMHHPNPNAAQVFSGLSIRQQSLDVVQLHKVCWKTSCTSPKNRFAISKTSPTFATPPTLFRTWKQPSRQYRFLDESLPHGASPRHRLCRRSHAPEIHRLLPQAPQRIDGLCPRLAGCGSRSNSGEEGSASLP